MALTISTNRSGPGGRSLPTVPLTLSNGPDSAYPLTGAGSRTYKRRRATYIPPTPIPRGRHRAEGVSLLRRIGGAR